MALVCNTTMDTSNTIAPVNKKHARDNQIPFATKEPSNDMIQAFFLALFYKLLTKVNTQS